MSALHRRWRSNILATWVISYILVLVVPISTWMASFALSKSIIQSQTDEINANVLSLTANEVDNILSAALFDLQKLSADATVLQMIDSATIADASDVYLAMQVKNVLARYAGYNADIANIYLYLPGDELILSQSTAASCALFYQMQVAACGISSESWKALLAQPHRNEICRIGQNSHAQILILNTLPVKTNQSVEATLVVQFAQDAFSAPLSKIGAVDGMYISIYDAAGQLMVTQGSAHSAAPRAASAAENFQSGAFTDSDGNHYFQAQIVSEQSGWVYRSAIASEIYTRRHSQLQTFTFVSLIFIVLFGVGMILYFIRRNYQPLEQLIAQLETRYQARKIGQSEYTFLTESISNIVDSHQQNLDLLAQQEEKLRAAYLQRLLTGHADLGVPVEEYLSLLGFDFRCGAYAVLLFDFGPDSFPDHALPAQMRRLADNAEFNGYSVELDGRIVFLMDCKPSHQALCAQIQPYLRRLSEQFDSLVLAVSAIHQSALGISQAYDEALYTLEYLLTLGNSNCLFYSALKADPAPSYYYYPPEEERRLIELVTKGEIDSAQALLDTILKRNYTQKGLALNQIRLLTWNFISSLYKASVELADRTGCPAFEPPLVSGEFSPEESRAQLGQIFDHLNRQAHAGAERAGDQTVERVLCYISENYSDPALSVEKICQIFSRSRSNLFTLIKEKTNEGLLYHINKTRIEAAKALLAHSRADVNVIGQQVGYISIQTFLRVFKKYEGVTPGKYRELVQQQKTL